MFQGPGAAPGTEAQPEAAPVPPRAVYEGYRRPEPRAERSENREDRPAGDFVGVLIEAWTKPPEIVRIRYGQAAAREARALEDRDLVSGAGERP